MSGRPRARMGTRFRAWFARAAGAGLVLAAWLAAPSGLVAQAAEPLSSQKLGRPYLFMFVAYVVVLGVIAAWVISIALRLARVEKRLQSLQGD